MLFIKRPLAKAVAFICLSFVSLSALCAEVNINTASAQEIADALKGIGLKKAEAIVEYRQNNGDFESVEQLSGVKGIGEKTIEKNRDDIQL
ncbi:MAG: ComEA family DNA-binding protein [Gammaproteobacteria bacterium]|nr:MAG: ComEA family DNA-binding protein [Gammaproteobacteria bacterium]